MYDVNGGLTQKAKKQMTMAAYAIAIMMVAMAVFTAFTGPIGAAIAMGGLGGIAVYIGRRIATDRPL